MTTEQMNREVSRWLEICWHEFEYDPDPENETYWTCFECGTKTTDPQNFTNLNFYCGAGIIRLLEEMMKREDGPDFLSYISHIAFPDEPLSSQKATEYMRRYVFVPTYFVVTPGKLLEAVHAWSKEHQR